MSRSNACLVCRTKKVRCDRTANTTAKCSTCTKLDRQCVAPKWTPEIIWPSYDPTCTTGDYIGNLDNPGRGLPLFSELERTKEVDSILASTRHCSLDQLLSQLDSGVERAQGSQALSAGPFSVICFDTRREDATQDLNEPGEVPLSPEWDDLILGDFSLEMPSTATQPGTLDISMQPGPYDTFTDANLPSILFQNNTFLFTVTQPSTPFESATQYNDLAIDATPHIQAHMSVEYAADLVDIDVPSIRLLLARYREKMIPTFAPVQALRKSLWERVHIPKLHETLGEILVKGDSGNPKCALLFAVLSAASYHLDAGLGRPPHHTATSWKEMGRIFRQRANVRLLASLRTVGIVRSKEDYEDMLLAVLSMVTVCVVSGDMVESYTYLLSVHQIIESACSPEMLKSTAVRMLHSTFLYLWTMQAKVRALGGPGQLLSAPSGSHQPNDAVHSDLWERLVPMEVQGDDDEESDGFSTSHGSPSIFEQVYSVSETLFRLIGRTRALALRVDNHDSSCVQPGSIPKETSDLENAICSWKNEFATQALSATTDIENRNTGHVRYLFQGAVHSALMVYFYKCVRAIDTYAVQPHVEKTISQLQLYTDAKTRSGDQSSGICWPAFVAACEALDKELQQKFSQWFSHETAQTGMRMFTIAGTAVKQVWDARDAHNNRNLPWTEILQSDNILDQLMLS